MASGRISVAGLQATWTRTEEEPPPSKQSVTYGVHAEYSVQYKDGRYAGTQARVLPTQENKSGPAHTPTPTYM